MRKYESSKKANELLYGDEGGDGPGGRLLVGMANRSHLRDPAGEDPELPVPAKQITLIPGPCFGIFVERHPLRPQRVMVGAERDLFKVGRLYREAMALLQVMGFRPVGGPAAKHEARRAWARANQLGVEVVGPSHRSRLLGKAGGHGYFSSSSIAPPEIDA